jgi:hypothetical protein
MRQFANFIKLTPSFRVASVTDGVVLMKSGYTEDKFPAYDNIEPSEKADRNDAGILYNIQVKAVVDKLTSSQKGYYGNGSPVIATMVDAATGETVIIGDTDTPAVVSYIPGQVYDQLVIDYASKTPVL